MVTELPALKKTLPIQSFKVPFSGIFGAPTYTALLWGMWLPQFSVHSYCFPQALGTHTIEKAPQGARCTYSCCGVPLAGRPHISLHSRVHVAGSTSWTSCTAHPGQTWVCHHGDLNKSHSGGFCSTSTDFPFTILFFRLTSFLQKYLWNSWLISNLTNDLLPL